MQHSEEDCGAACLSSIAKFHGREFAINRIREAVGTGQLGTTLLGLRRGAEQLGFDAQAVQASSQLLDRLNEAPLPAILHWKGNHWVVLYGHKGKRYVIADPAIGVQHLSRQELVAAWADRVMLLISPNQAFYEQANDKVSGFGRFLRRILPYRAVIAEAFLINVVLGLLSLTFPFLIQILTDEVLVRGDQRLLGALATGVIIMSILSSGLQLAQSNMIANFAQRLEFGLVLDFGRHILRLPLAYFEARRSGEVVSRLRDIQEINRLVSQVVINLPRQFFVALVSFSIMGVYSWKLTGAAVAIAAAMSVTTILFLPTLQRKIRRLLATEAENHGVLVEMFKGALAVKTTTAQVQLWEEYQTKFGQLANLTFSTIQIGIINSTFSGLVSSIGGISLLWFGSTLVIGQELTIGQLLAFKSMNDNFLVFVGGVIGFISQFVRVRAASQRLGEVIDATPETDNEDRRPYAPLPSDVNVSFEHVGFHYPGRVNLLHDFSVTIPGGKVTAVIGKSGCGKSSLAKLMTGLYSPQEGNIRIGLYNIQDLSLDGLRRQVVMVPQEPHLWSRSIVDNFKLGSPNVTFEQIVHACRLADADEFISGLPDKYQTILGEFGANLSGGQRQRLMLARALVTNPPILILDEATANLDPVSEAQLLTRLLDHRKGQTTILISHRPRVINRADWIVLLDHGQLQLQGPIDSLRIESGEHLEFLTP